MIVYFCARCGDFQEADIIHTIETEIPDKLYFFKCRECKYVWMEHDEGEVRPSAPKVNNK